jgi:predicted HTH transcriptional regulator
VASVGILPAIDESTLEALCSDRTPESATLEFKRELPDRSEKGRMEFLKDIAALANTSGGDIIYGIAESGGTAASLVPITGETFDEAHRRLAQSALASVEPPIQGLQFHEVRVKGGWCLAIRVPSSFASPRRYGTGGASRFVVRERGFVRDMSYPEVRDAFTRVV